MWSSVFSSLAVHAMAGVDCSLYGCERMVMHPARVCDEGHVVLCPSSLGNNSAALYYRISYAGRLRVSWSSHAFNAWLLRETLHTGDRPRSDHRAAESPGSMRLAAPAYQADHADGADQSVQHRHRARCYRLNVFQLDGVKNTVALLVQLLDLTVPLAAAARNSRPRDCVHRICLCRPPEHVEAVSAAAAILGRLAYMQYQACGVGAAPRSCFTTCPATT